MDCKVIGPIGIRDHRLEKKCNVSEGHTHNYDHTTIVITGSIKVTYSFMQNGVKVEGESKEFGPGEEVFIKADVFHTIKALEDNTSYKCIFSHRDFDGLVTQTYKGNAGAYQ